MDVLKSELELKNQEKTEMSEKIERLQAEVAEKEYDAKRAREERENLMNHYEKLLKDKISELSLEKRESVKIREAMAKVTPSKKTSFEHEVLALREELKKKSEVIRALEAQIPSPLSHSEEKAKKENYKLQKEIVCLKESHARELEKVTKAKDKIIQEYKDSNFELQKHIPPAVNSENDNSLIGSTPSHPKARGRRGRKARNRHNNSSTTSQTTATQVSFDDSENADPKSCSVLSVDDTRGGGSGRRRPKRGSRVSRNSKPPVAQREGIQLEPPLSPLDENQLKTPINKNGRKKLFTQTPGAEVFTPPELPKDVQDPHAIVTRQLRSRRSRKP